MLRTYVSLGILGIIVTVASAAQITSWDVTNNPPMYLNVSISSTQTTGITLVALRRNNSTVTFPTTTGGVLRIRQGSFTEDISYDSATVDATTKVVTLVSVTRDICWNVFSQLTSCGNGRPFSKGASVELAIDARLLNFKANKDRANVFTAAGGITFSGSGSISPPTFTTTAQRDTYLGASPQLSPILVACVTDEGLCYLGIGGVWVPIGDNGTPNASTTAAGKVEEATLTEVSTQSATGATGARLFINPTATVKTSGGAGDENKIPLLDSEGKLPSGFIPGGGLVTLTKTGSYVLADKDLVALDTAYGTGTITLPISPTTDMNVGVLFTSSGATSRIMNTNALTLASASTQYLYRNDADQTGLDITGNMTIEAWVKFTTHVANQFIVAKSTATGNQRGYAFSWQTGNILAFSASVDGITQPETSVAFTPTDGVWYHLAVVYTAAGGTADFYVNGVQQGAQQSGLPTSQVNNTAQFDIGAANAGVTGPMNATIDEVRVWNTTRTAAQILANKSLELEGTTSGLAGYWKLENVYTDSTANGNTVTAANAPTFTTAVPFGYQLSFPLIVTGSGYRINGSVSPVTMTSVRSFDEYRFVGTGWYIMSRFRP